MFVTYSENAIISMELKAIQTIAGSAGKTWREPGLRVGRATPTLSKLV